jgi:TPR repeat protein
VPAVGSGSADDALEAEGERYLYGTESPANCARAQRDLLAAAERSNAKGESVLGAMYATGHCVPRDLPLAYRWFAKALRQEPDNARFEGDVQILWNQMTPDERQTAMRPQ